jgi:hypothetical protein
VAKQARLDVLRSQRFAQKRIVEEIDLANRQVVSGLPVALHAREQLVRQRARYGFGLR